jgi:hypothetical protein
MMDNVDLEIRRALEVDLGDEAAFAAEVALRIARRAGRIRLAERSLQLLAVGASAIVLTPWLAERAQAVDLPTLSLSLAGCALALMLGPRLGRLLRPAG